jgi:hypothetical protein
MVEVARRTILFVACACLLALPADANETAHGVAERFAREAERAAVKKEQSAKEQEARRAAEEARQADTKRNEDAKRRAEEKVHSQAKAAEQRRAADQRRADEADMLARARREADNMRRAEEEERIAQEARRLINEAERERARAEELMAGEPVKREQPPSATAVLPKAEDPQDAQGETHRTAETERLASQRREETRRLIEKLQRVHQIREARLAAREKAARKEERSDQAQEEIASNDTADDPAAGEAQGVITLPTERSLESRSPDERTATSESRPGHKSAEILPPNALGGAPRDRGPPAENRFAVLLVMEPGNRGIRRHKKVADPVLCTLDGCYVSAGSGTAAHFLPGRKALSFGNAWGPRAWACRDSLGCIFRGVELVSYPGYLQPVDLRILKHDRRQGQVISADSACRVDGGRLSCGRGIYAHDYAMWVVPESLLGPGDGAMLERAVAEGLNGLHSAELRRPRGW